MAQPEIVDIADIVTMLGVGSTITEANRALITMLKSFVENDVRSYLRTDLTQATYTHYLPNRKVIVESEPMLWVENKRVTNRWATAEGDVLQLPQLFARSITSIYEDCNAKGNQQAGDFPVASLLTAGTDYFLDIDESGLARASQVRRIGTLWSRYPRTIKVTYVAGFTAAEIDATYSDIRELVVNETVSKFKLAKSRLGTGSGGGFPIKSEKIGTEYAVSYDTGVRWMTQAGLSDDARAALEKYVNILL